ncbi:MAG: leucine-rich repeat protein [Eubacterium sp.]|nr:leucine-rich repeat protein [Eubacterium sp.]
MVKWIKKSEGEVKPQNFRTLRCLLIAVGLFLLGIGMSIQPEAQAKAKYYKIQGKWVGFEKNTGRLTWSAGINYIPKKIAGKTVKILGKWSYNKNKNIKDITVPSSVKKIEKGAFYGCPNLKRIVLPKNVSLGDIEKNRTFWDSNHLETVVNNPDEKWKARMETFYETLTYLQTQDPQSYVKNVRSFKNQWIVGTDGKHIDYTDEAWAVVEKKAEELTKGCSTDMEKAKAISKWIVGYLHYDEKWMEKFQEWRKTHDEDKEEFPIKKVTDAYGLITWDPSEHDGETAMTTCGGYGNLTQALFAAAGIPCVHVHRVQKEGESIDHVFNVAYIDGKWRWLDNTYSDKNLDYFDCAIAGMSASDHRCDRLNLVDLSELLSGTSQTLSVQGDDTEYVKVDGLSWGINRNAGSITWFPKDWDGLSIPTELDGMKVTRIGQYACQNRDTIRELVIPEGITEVEEGAFRGCSRLSKLTIPASVKKLGNYAFSSCDELETILYAGDKKQIKFGNYVYADTYFLHPDFSDAYKKGIYYKQLNEVKLTGDFSDDMIAIGSSQLGYHQGNDESEMHGYNKLGGEYYSEYNYFTGSPDWQWGMKGLVKQSDYEYGYGGWCGNYCEWCMSMAGLPPECSGFFGHKNVIKWKDTVYAGGS